ncbi:multidrug effflux MFS transporter [Facilibium subflavum]|uniref:multidrug effflux MFS transporter n=1 Tax=Facilibium subflavum TaxID=2219058 RepID=UPI000E648DD0|nr:multidrug effflux MFS transporter [Facilibium subflavum]
MKKYIKAAGIPSLFILVLMISVGPFGDTIYAPSLPSIAKAFNTPYHNVQLTITFYLLGYSISQLLYGPFSDRFGRKPVMVIGAGIFFIGSTICWLSHDIFILIIGRFIQGFGACAGAVISSAAVRDAFSQKQQGQVFAQMNTAFAIAPGLGAIVGTFITWQMNFSILFVLAIVLFICVIFLFPETLKTKNKGATRPKALIANYWALFRTPGYLIYLCILGLNIGMVYSCLVEAPALVIDLLHLSKPWFMVIAVGIVVAFMIGSILCSLLCTKLSQNIILLFGMCISLVGSSILMVFMLLKIVSLLTLLIPVIIIFTGIAFVIPIATAKALAPFTLTAGSASAMMGFFQMGMASAITAIVTTLPLSRLLTMPVSFISLSLLGILVMVLYLLLYKKHA